VDFRGIVVTRSVALLAVLVAVLVAAPGAGAADFKPFDQFNRGCVPDHEIRACYGNVANRVPTFDGVPLDVDVGFPAEGDGPFPLVVLLHGWGGSKGDNADISKSDAQEFVAWAKRGYAVLKYTARGWNQSCGNAQSRLATPNACAGGNIKLARTSAEVRDTQYLAEILADEGLIDPQKIGVTGPSYGGGQSMALAALKDRTMDENGALKPWVSKGGKQMRIAAAAPSIPWTDLTYSLLPNGRHLDYTLAPKDQSQKPIGIMKQSFVSGLYALGNLGGYYAPAGTDPTADLTQWFALINAGEPYNENPQATAIAAEIANFHSSYAIDDSQAPAPLFISNGWTDDLFPVDEALRFYNRMKAKYATTPLALMFFDYGHQRGQNKAADTARYRQRIVDWFERYVKGNAGQQVLTGVETLTETCPKATASGGPFNAASWEAIHPGEVRFTSKDEKSFTGEGSDPSVSQAMDPITGGGACATTASDDGQNTATYRLPKATGTGYTIMGSPTVVTKLSVTGAGAQNTQVVGRLWDVAPDGNQTLIARGLYRPLGDGSVEVFQLHPAGYAIAADHVVKLELLGADPPYARKSNGTFQTTVQGVDLRLPVAEKPVGGTGTGPITEPVPPLVPPGQTLAPDVPGGVTATGEPVKPGGTAPGKRGVTVRLKLRVKYRKASGRAGKTCKRRKALVQIRGKGTDQISRIDLAKGKKALGRDKKAPYQLTLSARGIRKGNYAASVLVRDGRRIVLKGKLKRLC
jgi:predicted acyl esterase